VTALADGTSIANGNLPIKCSYRREPDNVKLPATCEKLISPDTVEFSLACSAALEDGLSGPATLEVTRLNNGRASRPVTANVILPASR